MWSTSHLQFVLQVADFGLAHASKDGSIFFEPVNTEIRGTPGQDMSNNFNIEMGSFLEKLKKNVLEKVNLTRF